MRTRRLYRWPDHAVWRAALAAQGWQEGTPPGVDLLVTGIAFGPSSDPEMAGPALPGWHVAGLFLGDPPAAWEAQRIVDVPAGVMTLWPAPTQADYQAAIEALVQATARSRSYDDAASCAGYVASTVPTWRAEAEAFVAWRDGVYIAAFTALAAVQAGEMAPPSVEAFVASLPAMVWPA